MENNVTLCQQDCIRTHAVAEEADVVPTGAQNQLTNLQVEFDNDSDPDATIIKVLKLQFSSSHCLHTSSPASSRRAVGSGQHMTGT